MEKLLKKPLLFSSQVTDRTNQRFFSGFLTRYFSGAAVFTVALFFLFSTTLHAAPKKKKEKAKPKVEAAAEPSGEKSEENYQDLIQKAQNLTLQQDRLQTSQVLLRGIQRETRGSVGFREMVRALDDLTSVFYSAKAQNLFSTAESSADLKPREALESYQEALKAEDRNVTILKALARAHLRLDECDKADARVKLAEEVNPYSAEVRLLRLQTFACQKNFDMLATRLGAHDADLEPMEKFVRGLQVLELVKHKDLKKARIALSSWEAQAPDYPEVFYWKWQISLDGGSVDRLAATKYSQLCQNMTPRKRKNFSLDVDLCKGKDAADAFLKEKEAQAAPPVVEESK